MIFIFGGKFGKFSIKCYKADFHGTLTEGKG
jgi:hypothetical protein